MKFDSYINTILEKHLYTFWKTCIDCDDGNEVQKIVDQDDLSYNEDTYFHNPEHQISAERFIHMTGLNKPYDFYGYNSNLDIVFGYDELKDRHDFFIKSK